MQKKKSTNNQLRDHCFYGNYKNGEKGCQNADLHICCNFCKIKACDWRCKDDIDSCNYICTEEETEIRHTVDIPVQEVKHRKKKEEITISKEELEKRLQVKKKEK